MLADACSRGFARLPPPDPADLYFDLEGFPFATSNAAAGASEGGGEAHGLEYLWGVSCRDLERDLDLGRDLDGDALARPGDINPRPAPRDSTHGPATEYRSWWAHDAAGEKAALEAFQPHLTLTLTLTLTLPLTLNLTLTLTLT